MTERTYTMNADLMDRVATLLNGSILGETLDELLTAIKSKQPKPRIKWELGLKLRERGNVRNVFTCITPTKFHSELGDTPSNLLLAWDNVIHCIWTGFDGQSFDPHFWEVV